MVNPLRKEGRWSNDWLNMRLFMERECKLGGRERMGLLNPELKYAWVISRVSSDWGNLLMEWLFKELERWRRDGGRLLRERRSGERGRWSDLVNTRIWDVGEEMKEETWIHDKLWSE